MDTSTRVVVAVSEVRHDEVNACREVGSAGLSNHDPFFYPLHRRFNDGYSVISALFSFPVSMEHFVLLRMITPADLFYVSSRRLFVYAGLRYGHLCPTASLFRLL